MRVFTTTAVSAAAVLVAASAFAEAPTYQRKTVFESEERDETKQRLRTVQHQLTKGERSRQLDRLYDDTDRRIFRRLRRTMKRPATNRQLSRVRGPAGKVVLPQWLEQTGLGQIERMLLVDRLRLTPTRHQTARLTEDELGLYTKFSRSNVYARHVDGRLKDAYTWEHIVVEERSVYEERRHNLFVYADDGRLDRIYQWIDQDSGVTTARVQVRWSGSDVTGFEVRRASSHAQFDISNYYEIIEHDAVHLALAKK